MGIVALDAGYIEYPQIFTNISTPLTAGNLAIDASGEYSGLVFRAPKAGNLRRFEARLGAISNLPDNGLRFSFQTVDETTGLPDGTVDQFATIAVPTASAWNVPANFDADRAVGLGELVAAIIDIPTFVVGDSVFVQTMGAGSTGHPYGVSNGAKNAVPILVAVMYDDGTYAYLGNNNLIPFTTLTAPAFAVSTGTADEYGQSFSLGMPARCAGMVAHVALAAGGSFEFLLYEGTTVRRTATVDSDTVGTTASRPHAMLWDDGSYDLAANTVYTAAVRPTGAQAATLTYASFNSLAIVQGALSAGNSVYLSRRLDQGAWTHFNNATDGFARAPISVLLSGFIDPTPSMKYRRSRVPDALTGI